MAHMVSQKGIERERDGEEDKAIETTSRCIFGSWRGKHNTYTYIQCFSHLWENLFLQFYCGWRHQQLEQKRSLWTLWAGREKRPVVLLIPICGSFCCHLLFKGVFPPYLFMKLIPIRQRIIPQKLRFSGLRSKGPKKNKKMRMVA